MELHFQIRCLPMTKGHLLFSLPILALNSPINSSLSVRGMPLSTLANWLYKASLFTSGFVIVGACTLVIVAKLSVLRGSLIVMILSLIGRDISIRFVTMSFFLFGSKAHSIRPPFFLVRVGDSRRKSIPSR